MQPDPAIVLFREDEVGLEVDVEEAAGGGGFGLEDLDGAFVVDEVAAKQARS